jgi:hypothetical protein
MEKASHMNLADVAPSGGSAPGWLVIVAIAVVLILAVIAVRIFLSRRK